MNAGELDRIITLYAFVEVRDPIGGVTTEYVSQGDVYAKKQDIGGREYLTSQQVLAENSAKFYIRWRDDITEKWRIEYEGTRYDIQNLAEWQGRRQWLEIVAKKVTT